MANITTTVSATRLFPRSAAFAAWRAIEPAGPSVSQCCVSSSFLPGHTQQLRSSGLVAPVESRKRFSVVAKASQTEVDPSGATSDLVKTAQEAWSKVDDKLAIGGLGFAGVILLWASTGLVSAIDRLPLLPGFFEFVGISFSGWFIYRYLLFKPDREELRKLVDEAKSKITGQ